ncbi:MAG: hypothetical protein ACXVLM_06835, partial [Ilumatobacteraceae bacterium]
MSDSWLDSGHGPEPAHLATIFTSATPARATGIDHSLDAANPFTTSDSDRRARRSSRLLVVTALWLGISVGTAGAAYAVRDALFPSIGPAAVSVWQNPGREPEQPATDDSSTTTTTTATPVLASTSPAAATEVSVVAGVESPGSSSEPGRSPSDDSSGDRTVHTGSTISPDPADDNTTSSVDDHGGGSDSGGGSGSGGG